MVVRVVLSNGRELVGYSTLLFLQTPIALMTENTLTTTHISYFLITPIHPVSLVHATSCTPNTPNNPTTPNILNILKTLLPFMLLVP